MVARKINKITRITILERQNYKCANKKGANLIGIGDYVCPRWDSLNYQGDISDNYEIDHIVEYSITNDNSLENLQALCRDCHGIKNKNFSKKNIVYAEEDYKIVKEFYNECDDRLDPDKLYNYICSKLDNKMLKSKFKRILKKIRLDLTTDEDKFKQFLIKYNYKYYYPCYRIYCDDVYRNYEKTTEIYNLNIDKYMEPWIKNNYMDLVKQITKKGILI